MSELGKAVTARRTRVASDKPRVRASADGGFVTADSFQNFATRTGVNAGNIGGAGNYGFNPLSRNRLRLEWAYRGSWIVGQIVDCVAEDMARDGIEIQTDDSPEDVQALEDYVEELGVWNALQDTIKWARLYGGAVAILMIDGQDTATPLDLSTIGKDQFKGLMPIDRWALFPSLQDLVTDFGPDLGQPRFYEMRPDYGTGLPNMKIHYSRVVRIEGVKLPYWQKITENGWGMSVIERVWDRLIAFDSTTDGAAQLVYKSHLRTYKIDKLRDLISQGGAAMDGVVKQMEVIRQFQSNEGLTLMDTKDEFEVHQSTFTGLDLILLQFGQQLSGASQIPLVRLFGQSPAGLNATGESDLRTYYDGIRRQQTSTLKGGVRKVYTAAYRSKFGKDLPRAFGLEFSPLWQMDDVQRAAMAAQTVSAIMEPFDKGVTARSTTLKELRSMSKTTGLFTNITDDMISEAVTDDAEKPPGHEELGLGTSPDDPGRQTTGTQPTETGTRRAGLRPAA